MHTPKESENSHSHTHSHSHSNLHHTISMDHPTIPLTLRTTHLHDVTADFFPSPSSVSAVSNPSSTNSSATLSSSSSSSSSSTTSSSSSSSSPSPSSRQCRMCLDTEGSDFVAPCLCRGSALFVHRTCLDQWRSTGPGRAFYQCDVCHFDYEIEELREDERQRKLRLFLYHALVVRDIVAVILLVFGIISGIAWIIYAADSGHVLVAQIGGSFGEQHVYGFYYLLGVAVFFALMGIIATLALCYLSLTRPQGADDFLPCSPAGPYCLCYDCDAACGAADVGAGGEGAAACLACGLVLLLIFVVVGACVGVVGAVYLTKVIMQRHIRVLWLSSEVKKYIVKDLYGVDLARFRSNTSAATSSASSSSTSSSSSSTVAGVAPSLSSESLLPSAPLSYGTHHTMSSSSSSTPPHDDHEEMHDMSQAAHLYSQDTLRYANV